jgi:N-methylhydantoinase A
VAVVLRFGIDVGGTFTDLVAQPSSGGPLRMLKVPTTQDPSQAVLAGLRMLVQPGEDVGTLTHGTTAATNALLEGRGARTALVTTRGFRDVLEIGRQQRDHLYRLDVPGRTPPPVPRSLRFEVTERMDRSGLIQVPLDEAEVRRIGRTLKRRGVEAVAVSLLHSYANPVHEQRIGDLLSPAVAHVCLSSAVNAEYREYERTHTTCTNALLMPLVDRYLVDLEAGLASAGYRVPLRLMQSSGGMATSAAVRRVPLAMLMSGPAGGVAAARAAGAQAGVGDAVTLDMGGTSTDVCLIRGGRVETTAERRIDGQPVRMRSLAVESVGAGGGSIARVDPVGALRVGPRSAGALPGPACYGRGGEDATVTDACVVLGYLDPAASFGGLRIDADLAWRAIEAVGSPLGFSTPEAAAGIVEIANATMVRAIRAVTVQRGHDVRRCCLIAYGGAGPIHAGRLAQELSMSQVLVPSYSSAFSAYGCLVADLRYDAVRTLRTAIADSHAAAWEGAFREMEADLLGQLEREGVPAAQAVLRRSMDLRYRGQNYEIEVPAETGDNAGTLRRRFDEVHGRLYEYTTDEPVEGVNLRVAAIVPTSMSAVSRGDAEPADSGPARTRQTYHVGPGWVPTSVYVRSSLAPGEKILGPAIVQDAWSTVVVPPGRCCRCDGRGYLWIEAAP